MSGGKFASIAEARKFAEEVTGQKYRPGTPEAKAVDEAVEVGIVEAARKIARSPDDTGATYDDLVDLYHRQPNLSTRTSASVRDQAYSTPAPLAFVASRLADVAYARSVYEPTAGNGILLIEARDGAIRANEMNPTRAHNLTVIYPDARVSQENALNVDPGSRFEAVIANPPFGPVKDVQGNTVKYQVNEQYQTGEIDHAIVMKALEALADDGRAALIVAAPNKLAKSEESRSDAYNSKAKREFYYTLYNGYNVVDHFTVAGELYSRQGAAWPVDVIVIKGRGKSE